jgi:hypothetical protein
MTLDLFSLIFAPIIFFFANKILTFAFVCSSTYYPDDWPAEGSRGRNWWKLYLFKALRLKGRWGSR